MGTRRFQHPGASIAILANLDERHGLADSFKPPIAGRSANFEILKTVPRFARLHQSMAFPQFPSLVERLHAHATRPAIRAADGVFSYAELLNSSSGIASALLGDADDLAEAPVAFLIPPSFAYVAALFGIFRAGGIAVPLCLSHPAPELAYLLDNCGARYVITHPEYAALLAPLAKARGCRILCCLAAQTHPQAALPRIAATRPAMLIYTSGTTGKPKGAISTHAILAAQTASIVEAWEISERDHILHVLPLHHLHGILNALLSILYAGATCELLPQFDALEVWRCLVRVPGITLFMGVPTIYSKLLAAFFTASLAEQAQFSAAAKRLRLMISGSAALPMTLHERFQAISGHILLERYGMTEIGMGLGNPLHGERIAGSVGMPFPRVEARLVDESAKLLPDGQAGELEIRGPNVFQGYWNNPEATAAVFTHDGWFKTGDIAVREQGRYRLLGRSSVDILKTGGFKVSALEIEETLREHPAIAEVCVIGISDAEWGQRVAAFVELQPGKTLELAELRAWGKLRLAAYKVPSILQVLTSLPRNAMGKVQKSEIQKQWERQHANPISV